MKAGLRLGMNLILALWWAYFAYTHLLDFFLFYKFGSLLYGLAESFVFKLFLLREEPSVASAAPLEWAVAFVGTFLGLLYRPDAVPDSVLGTGLIFLGVLLSAVSLLYLNKSFGIVPALRTIKFGGPYKLVRHLCTRGTCSPTSVTL